MDGNKAEKFSPDLVKLAALAKALGHPGRLEILKILAGGDSLCGGIVKRMPLSQATVSQHLKELKRVGLIRGVITGPRICYCLDGVAVARAREGLATLFQEIEGGLYEREHCEERG